MLSDQLTFKRPCPPQGHEDTVSRLIQKLYCFPCVFKSMILSSRAVCGQLLAKSPSWGLGGQGDMSKQPVAPFTQTVTLSPFLQSCACHKCSYLWPVSSLSTVFLWSFCPLSSPGHTAFIPEDVFLKVLRLPTVFFKDAYVVG